MLFISQRNIPPTGLIYVYGHIVDWVFRRPTFLCLCDACVWQAESPTCSYCKFVAITL